MRDKPKLDFNQRRIASGNVAIGAVLLVVGLLGLLDNYVFGGAMGLVERGVTGIGLVACVILGPGLLGDGLRRYYRGS